MNFTVLHIENRQIITGGLDRHITRLQWDSTFTKKEVWVPKNADPKRTHGNKELVSRRGVDKNGRKITLTLQQAVDRRLNKAGVKLRKNQATSLEIIFSGSPERFAEMSPEETKSWAKDTVSWAKKTWGKDNVVSAILHVDEKTPHIHMIVVPIVTGQSRRTLNEKQRKKRKKSYSIDNTKLRLCANEVFTLGKLYAYHDSYAKEVGNTYGFERGVRAEPGSKVKHQTSEEYNRKLAKQAEEKESLIKELTCDYESKKDDMQQLQGQVNVLSNAVQEEEEKLAEAKSKAKSAEDELASQQMKILENGKTLDNQEAELNAVKEQIEKQKNIISSQQETIEDIRSFLDIFHNAQKKAEEREGYLMSLASMGLMKMVQSIPELILKDVQERVKGYWKGTVLSFEKVQKPVGGGDNEDFVKINMRNGEHEYYIEVEEQTGCVYLNGRSEVYKWKSTGKEMYMPKLASYFREEVNDEALQFVESLYKHPSQTEDVVWNCSLGLEPTRIIHRLDGKYELQKHSVNGAWEKITAFKSYNQLGNDSNFAFLSVTRSNGNVDYVNQYGTKLSAKQLKSIGIKRAGTGLGR